MLTAEQCRAARGWLDWTISELAGRAHVGISTIRSFESGERTPIQNNLEAIRRALEAEGIVFVSMPNGDLGITSKARGDLPRAVGEKGKGVKAAPARKRKEGAAKRKA
jgi:transcriptional regulator with XRE-family HTH domain